MHIVDLLVVAPQAAPQNKFGFAEALEQGGFIAYATVAILAIMSFGSFYILFTKIFEQNKVMKEYRTNRDPVLETALNFSGNDLVLDPMGYLKELFMANKLDVLEQEAKRMVSDPKYRFLDFNSKFNQAGYDLLNGNQIEPAIYVFTLNTKLYPDSANAWDSLGEACLKANQKDKAIEYYNKAIALDPDGSIGDNARNMLKQINGK